jgi:Na+/proline symporter
MMVQRYLSARSQSDAAKAILWSGVIVFLQFSLFLFIGMLLGCFYQSNLLPEGTKPDQVFAHFIIHSFPANTGLVGLMLAAILAAVMSTLSSSLSASASSVVSDLWLSNLTKTPSQHSQVTVTRIATVFFGILQIGIGIWAGTFARSVVDNALTIAGFSTGILLGWFSLALLTQKRSQRAAIFGGAVGLAVLLLLQFGLPLQQFGLPQWNVTIAFPWLPVFGSLATLLSGLLLNALLPCDSRTSVSLPVDNCTDQFAPSNAPTSQSPEP